MFDSFSITTLIHQESLLWTPPVRPSIAKRRVLNLDNFRSIKVYEFSIYRHLAISDLFYSISLDCFESFHLPNSSLSLQTSFPRVLWPWSCSSSLVRSLIPHFIMHFTFCDLTFGVFGKFWDFSKSMKFLLNFGMGFVYLILNDHALHHMCIITMFYAS